MGSAEKPCVVGSTIGYASNSSVIIVVVAASKAMWTSLLLCLSVLLTLADTTGYYDTAGYYYGNYYSAGYYDTTGYYYGNYYCRAGRDVVVQLFEWKWTDIESECRWLAQHDFCAVQVTISISL